MRILRVLRGIVTTAVTWAVVWVPVSLIPFGIGSLFGSPLPARVYLTIIIGQAVVGAVNGTVFATILAVAGRRKSFETLSLRWIAVCGAVGGALLPFLGRAALIAADFPIPASALLSTLITNGVLGAGLAATTLSLARRAPALRASTDTPTPAVGAGAT